MINVHRQHRHTVFCLLFAISEFRLCEVGHKLAAAMAATATGALAKAFFLIAALAVAFGASASDKKGIGIFDLQAAERVNALHVAWYYTWSLDRIKAAQAEFVPMVWGGPRTSKDMGKLRSSEVVPVLLTENEPDVRNQASMTVDEALRFWPDLSRRAVRIGSPAVSHPSAPWLQTFMRRAATTRSRVDFVAVHWYGPPDPASLLSQIDALHGLYGKPIWITEFGVADWNSAPWLCKQKCRNKYSEAEVLAFMRTVLPELERRSYVEKYAWFGAGKFSNTHEQVRTSRLFYEDGTLTQVGRFYSDFQ